MNVCVCLTVWSFEILKKQKNGSEKKVEVIKSSPKKIRKKML